MLVNMKEILQSAREGKYAVGFFNAVNTEMARAVIETAEELKAPVIIGTAEILLPVTDLQQTADYLIPMARRASGRVFLLFPTSMSRLGVAACWLYRPDLRAM